MSDDIQAPLDLRALAEVDTPDVVRAALRRFRRRAALWTVVSVLLAGALLAVVTAPSASPLSERYAAAHGHVPVGAVVEGDGARLVLLDAVRLGADRYGVRAVATADKPADEYLWAVSPSFPGLDAAPNAGDVTEIVAMIQKPSATEMMFTLPVGSRHAVVHIVTSGPDQELVAAFNLDLAEAGVPEWIRE